MTESSTNQWNDPAFSDFVLTDGTNKTYLHKSRLMTNDYFKTYLTTNIGSAKDSIEVTPELYPMARWFLSRLYGAHIHLPTDIDVIAALALGREWLISDGDLNQLNQNFIEQWAPNPPYDQATIDYLNMLCRLLDECIWFDTFEAINDYYRQNRGLLPPECLTWESGKYIYGETKIYLACKHNNLAALQEPRIGIDFLRSAVHDENSGLDRYFSPRQLGLLARVEGWVSASKEGEEIYYPIYDSYIRDRVLLKSLVPFCVQTIDMNTERVNCTVGHNVVIVSHIKISYTINDVLIAHDRDCRIKELHWIRAGGLFPVTETHPGLKYRLVLDRPAISDHTYIGIIREIIG